MTEKKEEIVVYVASRYSNRHLMRSIREDLAEFGVRVNSSWIDGGEETAVHEEMVKYSEMDLREIREADCLLLVRDIGMQGSWIEVGYALGLGKPVFMIDIALERERRNTFESLLTPCWDTGEFELLAREQIRDARKKEEVNDDC